MCPHIDENASHFSVGSATNETEDDSIGGASNSSANLIEVSYADRAQSQHWRKWRGTLDGLGEHFFSAHKIGPKDGECVLQGVLVGHERGSKAVARNYILTYDFDTGATLDEIAEKIRPTGLWCALHTTHSYGTTETDIAETAWTRFTAKRGAGGDDIETAKAYLRSEKNYLERVVDTVVAVNRVQTPHGVVIRVFHDPLSKCRAMFLLESPFEFVVNGVTQDERIKEWKRGYEAFGVTLSIPIDPKCKDPARLFYTPRHPKDSTAPHDIVVINGRALSWEHDVPKHVPTDAEIARAFDARVGGGGCGGSSAFKTPGLAKFLADGRSKHFLAAACMEQYQGPPRDVRDDKLHFECPLDDMHSDAGNPKDQGFFAKDADAGNEVPWQMWCAHATCSAACMSPGSGKSDRALYLDAFCVKHGIGVDDLGRYCPGWEGTAEGKGHKAKADRERAREEAKAFDIEAAIGALKNDAGEAALIPIYQAIAAQSETVTGLERQARAVAQAVRGLSKATILGDLRRCWKEWHAVEDGGNGADEGVSAAAVAFETKTEAVRHYNECYGVVPLGSSVAIAKRPEKMPGVWQFYPPHALELLHAPELVRIGDGQVTKAFSMWCEHPERKTWAGVVFEPRGVDAPPPMDAAVLNMWQGFAVTPVAGEWGRLREHIYSNICKSDAFHFAWLMCWLADMVQRPDQKPGTAVVLKGAKGTGKTKLGDWVRAIFPPCHALSVANREQILGRFSGHLMQTVFLVCEEVVWGGDKQSDGILKELITGETRVIEQKGKDAFAVANHLHLMLISNEAWVVPATEGERRYFVLEVGDERKEDHAYFAAIDAEMKAGGCEAMLRDLARLRQPDWVQLRKPPVTEALLAQIEEGHGSPHEWLRECLKDGDFEKGAPPMTEEVREMMRALKTGKAGADDGVNHRPVETVYASYRAYAEGRHERYPAKRETIGRLLRQIGVTRVRKTQADDRAYFYCFPPVGYLQDAAVRAQVFTGDAALTSAGGDHAEDLAAWAAWATGAGDLPS